MMFKGTPTYGKGQFAQVVEENGGQDNAFTSHDVTSYYVNIAAGSGEVLLSSNGVTIGRIYANAQGVFIEVNGTVQPISAKPTRPTMR